MATPTINPVVADSSTAGGHYLVPHKHNFNSIVNMHPENDDVYQLKGMHDIRSSVSKRKLTTQLSPAMLKQCRALDI